MLKPNLTNEEDIILEALIASRQIQEFIWGEDSLMLDPKFDLKIWRYVFQKRVDKIAEINPYNPSYKIELRKRVLQQAALSILALKLLA